MFTDDSHILLLKRTGKGDKSGQWGIPGGKAEENETYLGTAQRETKEEIGHLPKCVRLTHFDHHNGRHVYRIYICRVKKQFDCLLSDEHDDYKWVPIEDAKSMNLHDKLRDRIGDIAQLIHNSVQKNEVSSNMSGFASFLSEARFHTQKHKGKSRK